MLFGTLDRVTMRNVLFLLFAFGLVYSSSGQIEKNLGVKGGLNLTFFTFEEADFGPDTVTETGFYAGLFLDIHIDDFLSVQPEILYIGLNDFKFLNAPIYVKYEVAKNFDVLVGPSLNYFFDFFSNKFKVRADLSAAYNLSESVDVHTKFTLGFEEMAPNGLFFGVGMRL